MKIFLDTANLEEIREGAAMGVVDGPLEHLPTDIGLERFLADWEKAKKELDAKAGRQ